MTELRRVRVAASLRHHNIWVVVEFYVPPEQSTEETFHALYPHLDFLYELEEGE